MSLSINWFNHSLTFDSIIITENMNTDNTVEKILSNSRKYKRTYNVIFKMRHFNLRMLSADSLIRRKKNLTVLSADDINSIWQQIESWTYKTKWIIFFSFNKTN